MSCVTIVGGGNGAHVLSGLFGSNGWNVNIYTAFQEEVDKLQPALSEGIQVIYADEGDRHVVGKIQVASTKYEDVIPQADLVIICLPTFTHESLLKGMTPHLKENATVIAVGGCWWASPRKLLGVLKESTNFGIWVTLPWAARIKEYGRSVTVLGTTRRPQETVFENNEIGKVLLDGISGILGFSFSIQESFMTCMLQNPCIPLHCGIIYGNLKNASKFEEIPDFYNGMTDFTAEKIDAINKEMITLAHDLTAKTGVCIGEIKTMMNHLVSKYTDQVKDTSTLAKAFSSNTAYANIKFPVVPHPEGGYLPDTKNRFFAEDTPYGLAVVIGLADIVGTPVPRSKEIGLFIQGQMNKNYLGSDGTASGSDLAATRCPQRFDVRTLERLTEVLK